MRRLLIAALLTGAASSTAPPPLPHSTPATGERGVVVVDPGHNGANARNPAEINRLVDAGGFKKACNTVGTSSLSGLSEAAFNWALAQRLGAVLEQQRWRVVYTRTGNDGWGPCIDQRGQTAGRHNAVALLSVHADGAASSGRGFHVIWPVVVRGYTERTSSRSRALAQGIRDALVSAGFAPSNYAGRDGLIGRRDLGTLNRSAAPAVILELGNMRNQADDALLRSPDGQDRLARAVAQGFEAWAAAKGLNAPVPG